MQKHFLQKQGALEKLQNCILLPGAVVYSTIVLKARPDAQSLSAPSVGELYSLVHCNVMCAEQAEARQNGNFVLAGTYFVVMVPV